MNKSSALFLACHEPNSVQLFLTKPSTLGAANLSNNKKTFSTAWEYFVLFITKEKSR